MSKNILVVKESKAGEARVGLVPDDAKLLVDSGFRVFVENDAGKAAGFTNEDYKKAGASIRQLSSEDLTAYQQLFNDIDIIIRAKRPNREREIMENKAICKGTMMIGALDILEKNSPHIAEYQRSGIDFHSIDQLTLGSDHPMNILAAMSKMSGRLALVDAVEKFQGEINKVLIIGFGTVGRSAFNEAQKHGYEITVVLTNADQFKELSYDGINALLLDRQLNTSDQQQMILPLLKGADIVITSARRPNQPAPVLIPESSLKQMQAGSVIIDMAISEGGNVEDSKHDQTLLLGNGVIVSNTSGYPKIIPHEASILWSQASRLYVMLEK